MSAVPDPSVLGASLGSSGVRSVISDSSGVDTVLDVLEPVATEPAPNGLAPDPWDAVVASVHSTADEYASARYYPVLALRESDPDTAFREDFSDGIVLVSELGAQLGALRESGVLAGERCVALFDVGASGTSVSVIDVESGRVLASQRTEALRGDDCDRVLSDHLIETFGAAEALTVAARRQLVHDVRDGKHQLSMLRSVSVIGPFVGGRASLWRHDLDELIGDAVDSAVSTAVDVLASVAASGVHVEAIVAVGGGANMQIVRQKLFDAVSVPVYAPERPELLAARGAAGIARTVGVRPAPSPAVTTVPSRRPRHSGSPSNRMARAAKSRRVGGALAALIAVCVAGTVVAAAARTTDDVPEPSIATSQSASPSARSQAVMPAVDGSPSVSTQPSVSASNGAAPSSASPTSGDPSSSSSPTSPSAADSPPRSPAVPDASVVRPAREGSRVPTTTTAPAPTTTTTAPTSTTHPMPTTAPTTTAPTTTTMPRTTTRTPTSTKPATTTRRP
ncbi:Hsp70 family protein [Rhodococcus sp. IEGM 1354]|uniref:Hsp70 family protein n=1 Tax=Rhodococcus sp. IEGM 1354 TaxID=3047088 RepID=UPI0024B86A1C|nr:Hsp70 family protein [Rhodococcus sp. IEGM 1354]MDI9929407.1 Hsp70 family protein [Rhodococcus sp. IEGM 1354]